jgi:hypothetical protein
VEKIGTISTADMRLLNSLVDPLLMFTDPDLTISMC